MVDLGDDLTEKSDALVERGSKEEGFSIDIDDVVEETCELGDDIHVTSIDEIVFNTWLQCLLDRFW